MSFGKLGSMGRGFGTLGALGRAGTSGPPANTLQAGTGAFVLNGVDMAPVRAVLAPVDLGTFAITGVDAALNAARSIAAAQGTFTETGVAATLTYAPGGTFTPASLSPNWWFEAGKGGLFQSNAGTTAATANSDVVGFAPDQSGNTFTLTSAADDTTRPTLQGVGALPYLSFDGSNDLLRRTAALDGWNAGAATWAFAFRSNSNAANSFIAACRSSTTTNSSYSLIKADAGVATTAGMLVRDDAGTNVGSTNTVANANVFNGSDHVLVVIDTGSAFQVYLDGTLVNGVASYTHSQTLTLNRFVMGGSMSASAGNWWAGRIYGGVIVHRSINSTERASLTTYMGNLAGLSL